MSITVIYGSDAGATKSVATRIAKKVNGTALNITEASTADFESADLLILGAPTYGTGDLQSDWDANIDTLLGADLTGKKVALFGTGDQVNYPDSFVDAMGILYDHVVERGAKVVGFTDTTGYDYSGSLAERDGKFVGLALDQDNESGKTNSRISAWVGQLA